jgi:hypothetical protein
MSQTFAWPDSELETGLQLKESNRTILEFLSNNTLGLGSKACFVEPDGLFQIIDAKRDNSDLWLHVQLLHLKR